MIPIIPVLEVGRVEENYPWGTFGYLKIQKQVFCVTLEPPDVENALRISSIPAQQYWCRRYSSDRYPNTFQIMNVPDRTKVLLHAGNIVEHTEGCIILGQYWGKLQGAERSVNNSGKTFNKFMDIMKGYDLLHLTVNEHF